MQQVTISVLGRLWMPNCKATYTYTPTLGDNAKPNSLPYFTRVAIECWLAGNAGDFQEIIDFSAEMVTREKVCQSCGQSIPVDHTIEWKEEENECEFFDITYPEEE